jgi:peptide/nickel transport system substrate-binding protein
VRLKPIQQLIAFCVLVVAQCLGQGELHFCLHAVPKTFNPLMVNDDASETIRYLTGGVLVRLNRKSQQLEPELATAWSISNGNQSITFKLRPGLKFSDGTQFSVEDVAFTMKSLMDPGLHSPIGDAFRSGPGEIRIKTVDGDKITITFPAPVAGLDKLFDQVAIMSGHSPLKERAVLGPFMLGEYKTGSLVELKRNPNYWKTDSSGRRLPYLNAIYLHIQQNRELELSRFRS